MPTSPKPRCPFFGCLHRKPCPIHLPPARWAVGDIRTVAERGYGARHQRWRKDVLRLHPLCVYRFAGCTEIATVADHQVPISKGGARYDLSNGVGACRHCHLVKTRRERP
jgi:5-methylcytosine-specific restriction endonuclease McrA